MEQIIDVNAMAEYMRHSYEQSPYKQTLIYTLDALDRLVELASDWVPLITTEEMRVAFKTWYEQRDAWSLRVEEYDAALDGAETRSDWENYVAAPLFDGRYPSDMELPLPPDWPDVETPMRLVNEASLLAHQFPVLAVRKGGGWAKQIEDIFDEYQKKIDDYIKGHVKKETARRVTPFLVAGVGVVAILALSRTRR